MRRISIFSVILFMGILISCSKTEKERGIASMDFQPQLEKLKSDSISPEEKQKLIDEILSTAENLKEDSVRLKVIIPIAKYYLKEKDSLNFRALNQKRKSLAEALKDSTALASSNWDLAYFLYRETDYIDSAYLYYHEAVKIYEAQGDYYNAARSLINISTIQQDIKDYLGSEASAYKTLEFLQKSKEDPYQLYKVYNNLGVALNEFRDFDKALDFFQQAENQLKKDKYTVEKILLWNNMGSVLGEMKRYKEADVYFTKSLEHNKNLENENPFLYVALLNNIAQNRIESSDTIGLSKLLRQAMDISVKKENSNGIGLTYLSMAEYALQKKDSATAIDYTVKAKSSSEIRQDNRGVLYALTNLIQIDKINSRKHALEYIQLNDSLQQRDRLTQNKFAGIRYETDTYKKQSQHLSSRLLWVTITASGILITLGLLFIIFRQRSRNKELMLIQQKHEADEQVYKLVLKQQKKFEEGRIAEKKRIARELHDGILGKLFGLQLNLEILNQNNDTDSQELRFEYIDQLRGVGQEIRTLSHDLERVDFNQTDFSSLLSDYIIKQNSRKIQFHLTIDPHIAFEKLSADVRVNLFRIIQESIQNIHKHSEADYAEISLLKENEWVELRIKDNGKGEDTKKKKPGLGMKSMKSRAEEMNADFKINFGKQRGEGTQILLKIPLDE